MQFCFLLILHFILVLIYLITVCLQVIVYTCNTIQYKYACIRIYLCMNSCTNCHQCESKVSPSWSQMFWILCIGIKNCSHDSLSYLPSAPTPQLMNGPQMLLMAMSSTIIHSFRHFDHK